MTGNSAAANDLGLGLDAGDALKQSLFDAETLRKKKLMQQANGVGGLSPAAQALFPAMGMGGGFSV